MLIVNPYKNNGLSWKPILLMVFGPPGLICWSALGIGGGSPLHSHDGWNRCQQKRILDVPLGGSGSMVSTLGIQIPIEDRCLNPQTSPF